MNVDKYIADSTTRSKYESLMEHRKWMQEIPFIPFPSDWQVQVTPPFAGAVVRFRVKKGEAHVSVYLDCYDNLGCYGSPYWEVYPLDNDVFRCDMNDTETLLDAISKSLQQTA